LLGGGVAGGTGCNVAMTGFGSNTGADAEKLGGNIPDGNAVAENPVDGNEECTVTVCG